jgi:hypothetical protein
MASRGLHEESAALVRSLYEGLLRREPDEEGWARWTKVVVDGLPLRTTKGHFAVKALCSSIAGERVRFNVASNRGASSSMLELSGHGGFFRKHLTWPMNAGFNSRMLVRRSQMKNTVDPLRLSKQG